MTASAPPRVDVLCAGIIVVDHIASAIDRLPDAGGLVLTDDCILSIGGCASNVAVDLAKLAVPTAVCGCVGDDPFGQFARNVLDDSGLDTRFVSVTDAASTSQTLIINVKGQDRRFIHLLGANQVFSTDRIPRELFGEAKILYVGGYFLMPKLDPASLAEVFRQAHQAGMTTMLDVVTPGPGDYLRQLEVLLPETDVFLPNNDEGELITGRKDPVDQAKAFLDAGAKTAVITCGGQGCVLLSGDAFLRAKAFSTTFVDGTGGGDAFDAGYIAGLLEGAGPERCLELGSALGASCVRMSGATSGVFNRPQLDAFLHSNRLIVESLR